MSSNATAGMSSPDSAAGGKSFPGVSYLILVILTVGTCGTVAVQFVLRRVRIENRRYRFLLRCLATNDCVALTGMLAATVVRTTWPQTVNNVWRCRYIVLWRFFGLGSGCMAVLMAVERWLAITRPFFYQRHITEGRFKGTLIGICLGVFCLVCAPFFGFGIYWNDNLKKCHRVRDAIESLDVVYTCLYFGFIASLCIVITYSNLDVIRVLYTKERSGLFKFRDAINDESNGVFLRNVDLTDEEKWFILLMFLLCFSFVVCWLPQLISIPLGMFAKDAEKLKLFQIIGDLLLIVHLSVDPYIYLLHIIARKSTLLRRQT